MRRIGHPQSLPTTLAFITRLLRSHTGQVFNLRPAHPEHLDKGGCQMPSARLPHLEGVGVEKGPADESLQSSATEPPNLHTV